MTRTTKILPITDLFGIFYVRKPNGSKWDCYYRTIDALRPLLESFEFNEAVEGFYLNVHGEDYDMVRISYFVSGSNNGKEIPVFREFFKGNGMIEIKQHEPPQEILLAKKYGGAMYEQRYRKFLVNETQIGLELMKGDLLQARILLAIYRWQVKKAALPMREYLEPTLMRHSPTYNAMSEEEKQQFFMDLNEWPDSSRVDWAHMMVNLVLGADWKVSRPSYLTPGKPLPIPEINGLISDMGFQIPLDWKP